MTRSILISYFFVPLFAVTFAIVWIGVSSSKPSPQPVQSTEPVHHTQSAPAILNPESVVQLAHHGPNHPPVVNSPVDSRSRVVLFPMGPGAVLKFEGEPATDHEEDVLTYRFGIAIPGKIGMRSLEEALLQVTQVGSRFFIRPHGIIAPARFKSVYGNVSSVPVLPAVIYASDGKSESKPVFFTLTLLFDTTTRYSEPTELMEEYPGKTPEPAGRFKEASDSVDEAYARLKKVVDESRVWRLDPPTPYAGTVPMIQTTR